jgi:hypothetical protein
MKVLSDGMALARLFDAGGSIKAGGGLLAIDSFAVFLIPDT